MGIPFALASKTGEEGEVFFFKLTIVLVLGRGDWGGSVHVGAPIRRSHTLRCEKAGRCTYMSVAFWLKPLSVQGSGSGIPQTWLVHERRQVGNGL